MQKILVAALFFLGIGFIASDALASDTIAMRHSATFPEKGGHVIVIEFFVEDLEADICFDTLTVKTNIGTESIEGIGCSMATRGGKMTFFYAGKLPDRIEILKATGVKDGKTINAQGMLAPVEFRPLSIVNKASKNK